MCLCVLFMNSYILRKKTTCTGSVWSQTCGLSFYVAFMALCGALLHRDTPFPLPPASATSLLDPLKVLPISHLLSSAAPCRALICVAFAMEQETPSSQVTTGLQVCRAHLSSLQLCPGCWGPHLVRIPEAAVWEAQAGLHVSDFALHRITPGALKTIAVQATASRLGQKVGAGISSKDPRLLPCVAMSGHHLLVFPPYSGQHFPLSA
uniref:Uncharacterized protein n=1 Tax=Myotis myotis TaxID=51298 RepID=A0A7J7WHN2_MYOMY|nr:hypothetical protein mMyoMyo1_012045 [Myotis myotis]